MQSLGGLGWKQTVLFPINSSALTPNVHIVYSFQDLDSRVDQILGL